MVMVKCQGQHIIMGPGLQLSRPAHHYGAWTGFVKAITSLLGQDCRYEGQHIIMGSPYQYQCQHSKHVCELKQDTVSTSVSSSCLMDFVADLDGVQFH